MSVDVLHPSREVGGFGLSKEDYPEMPDLEASFSVKLFPEGFSVGKPLEKGKAPPPGLEATGMLYPYSRASETFLRALDGGWIPADLLEDIPCKYVNGCIACEILDYCASTPPDDTGQPFSSKSSSNNVPAVYKIILKPSMESIAKDVASMVDETFTYKDEMEIESKLLRRTWPELQLDPKSTIDHTENRTLLRSGPKIFQHIRSRKAALINRRLRWAAISAKATVKAGSLVNTKKIAFEMAPERLIGETNRESSLTGAEMLLQFGAKPKTSGSFPSSPKPNMLQAQPQPEMTGAMVEKQSSLLGKRDGRDFGGVKVEMKRHKPLDKELGIDNTLDMVKSESQGHVDDTSRMRDQGSGFGLDNSGQAQFHEPQAMYQRLAQQDINNQSWQASGMVGDKDNKQDELLQQKRRLLMMQQKLDGRFFQQQMANDISRMSTGMMHNVGPAAVATNLTAAAAAMSPSLSHSKDQLQAGSLDPMLQAQQLSRRRANSLPKNAASIAGVASPGSTINSGGPANVNSPSTASMPPLVPVRNEGLIGSGQRNDPVDNFMVLLAVAQRHGLPPKRQKVDQPPPPEGRRSVPLFHELECALNTPIDEIKDPKGQRNMADSLIGGINTRKTRFLQFQRQILQGQLLRRVRVRLVMCERGRDAMVEAVVQFGDDQDDDTLNSVPHHVLPTMANAHTADLFAKQFCALLEKEGFELVEDQVQPTMPRASAPTNAASAARPLPAGASTLGNGAGPLSSPHSLMNPHMPAIASMGGMPGMSPLQPSSPGALSAATRMPPPGNASNRQIPGGYLNQPGLNTASKPLQLDGTAAQLAGVQHQPQLHLPRAQQMVIPNQLAQMNLSQAQQQMVANPGQLQQFLQQQQQQRQQTQASVLQRKYMGMGSLGAMGNLGGAGFPPSSGNQGGLGNMVGVNAMNNVVGMSGVNNVSASMGGMSGMNNAGQLQGMVALGQNTGLGNLIGRPGNLNAAQLAAFSSKAHLAQGRANHPMGAANPTARDNLPGLNASNQLHVSAGLPMMGQTMSRVGRVSLTPIQRAAAVGGLGSPRLATSSMPAVAAQGMYLNPSQQVNPQQQFSIPQLGPMQQTGQQQPLAAQQLHQLAQQQQQQHQQQQQQQANSQVAQQQQQQPPPTNPQQQQHQQLNTQQPKTIQPVLSPQSGLLSPAQQPQASQQQLNTQAQITPAASQQNTVSGLGSLIAGPGSPQESSQNVGSVCSTAAVEPSATNCSVTSLSSG